MLVKFDVRSVHDTTWSEYTKRFLFGGAVTVLAGLVADKWGPAIGGLFLAFPAIFPASASLIDRHQKEKKERAGLSPGYRGRLAAGADAAGAAMGCVGLATFAILASHLLPGHGVGFALATATAAWTVVSILVWMIARRV